MRSKIIMLIMSALLVLGFSAPLSADWVDDQCGDAITPIKDLLRAKVEIFHDDENFPEESPWIYLCYEMCPESTIPGIVIWEFDVDNNSATGGTSSMTGIPLPPCPCKVCAGYDILIMKAYRDQGPESAMGWCSGCVGQGAAQCATRGVPVACDQGICYELDQPCVAGEPGCYKISEECTGCVGGIPPYYTLDEPCPDSSCGIPAKKGEWKASSFAGGTAGGLLVDWGRDIPKPPDASTPGRWCEKLPWGEIVRDALDAGMPIDPIGVDPLLDPPNWQVSIYYDPVFADQDDYVTGFSVDISDWLPEGDCNKAEGELLPKDNICHLYQNKYHCCLDLMVIDGQDTICKADTNADGKVNLTDLVQIKSEFLRNDCPCGL